MRVSGPVAVVVVFGTTHPPTCHTTYIWTAFQTVVVGAKINADPKGNQVWEWNGIDPLTYILS